MRHRLCVLIAPIILPLGTRPGRATWSIPVTLGAMPAACRLKDQIIPSGCGNHRIVLPHAIQDAAKAHPIFLEAVSTYRTTVLFSMTISVSALPASDQAEAECMRTSARDIIDEYEPEPCASGPAVSDVSASSSCPAGGGRTGRAPSVSSKPPWNTSTSCKASEL